MDTFYIASKAVHYSLQKFYVHGCFCGTVASGEMSWWYVDILAFPDGGVFRKE